MNGDQIRQTFREFFEGKGHTAMPSCSVVPTGDPTMLFTSAGMVPFKPYFTGETTPPSRRLTSCQKSFRTTDVDEVGDHKHLTFFEMLGNFSIGDYFKKEAIAWCWEFVTEHFKLPPESLYITIYQDDEEAFQHWNEDIGVPPERIFRYGVKDNWWGPAGKEGPCGPCSEVHYDTGVEHGCGQPDCHPNHDCERFVELWNLVFMQYYQDPEGKRTPLPRPSIDTGMGLERAAAILQGKSNLYETDLFQPIIARACQLSGKTYGQDREIDYALRVVAEHGRAAAFLIADGVVPRGDDERGSVLQKVLRRAIRYGRKLGIEEPFLAQIASVTIERFQHTYPELETNREFILRVAALEEERFDQTLERASELVDGLKSYRDKVKHKLTSVTSWHGATLSPPEHSPGEAVAHQALIRLLKQEGSLETAVNIWLDQISGYEISTIHTTYGFPPELTSQIAREQGFNVDLEGLQAEFEVHKAVSRASEAFSGGMEVVTSYENLGVDKVDFVGYEAIAKGSVITAVLVDGEPVGHASKGQTLELVLKETPFYAESGGQVGDAGVITGPNGKVWIEDTQSPVAGLVIHRGVVEEGDISLGEPVEAHIDPVRRLDTARNHSSTHLLHAALRQVLGFHVRQAGSLVTPDRLRFDYSHVSPLPKEELLEIQGLVNQKVRNNLKVSTTQSTYAQAISDGALAFFGDKYGDVIRVVEMSDGERFSYEVCGGTHVSATGEVGPIFVLGESSVGGGMRRVEAVSGRGAEELFVERTSLLESLSNKLQTPLGDLDARMDSFISDFDALRKRAETLERENLRKESQDLLGQVQDVGGIKVLAARTTAASSDAMLEMGDWLKERMSSGVIVLGAVQNGRPNIVSMVTSDLIPRGLHAGNIAKETAQVMDGGGGGRPEMAQAGGKRADKLDEALARVAEVVRKGAGL